MSYVTASMIMHNVTGVKVQLGGPPDNRFLMFGHGDTASALAVFPAPGTPIAEIAAAMARDLLIIADAERKIAAIAADVGAAAREVA